MSEVNVSAEIRALVSANKEIRGAQVLDALKQKFPKQSFNPASVQVAFANARKRLGLTRKPGRAVRRRQRVAVALHNVSVAAKSAAQSMDAAAVDMLHAAKSLLQYCKGDVTAAQLAVEQIAALQLP